MGQRTAIKFGILTQIESTLCEENSI